MFIYSVFITTFQKSNTVVFLLSPSDIVLNIFSGNDRESKSGIVFIYPSQLMNIHIRHKHTLKKLVLCNLSKLQLFLYI